MMDQTAPSVLNGFISDSMRQLWFWFGFRSTRLAEHCSAHVSVEEEQQDAAPLTRTDRHGNMALRLFVLSRGVLIVCQQVRGPGPLPHCDPNTRGRPGECPRTDPANNRQNPCDPAEPPAVWFCPSCPLCSPLSGRRCPSLVRHPGAASLTSDWRPSCF